MYAFQIFEAMYSDDKFVDTENILWLLPVCMVVIPFVYFIRIKLYDKHVHGIDLEAMDAELQAYRERERQQKEKETRKVERMIEKEAS
jgi:amino acid permease